MKKWLASGAVALSLLFAPLTHTAVAEPQAQQMIIKDGMYDNHNAFVDESRYSLDEILESVEVLGHEVAYSLSYETLDGKIRSTTTTFTTSGTGIVIEKKNGKAYILTNNHLTEETIPAGLEVSEPYKWLKLEKTLDRVYVEKEGGLFVYKVSAKEVASDPDLDIALLEVDDSSAFKKFPYKIGDSDDLRTGDFLWMIGNPLGIEDYTLDGNVSRLAYDSNSDWFMIGSDVQPGYSGGAVIAIRDGKYELVGLVVATLIRPVPKGERFDALGGYGIGIKINPAMKVANKYLDDLD